MKFKNPKYNFAIEWNHIEWGQSDKTKDTDTYFSYFYWFDLIKEKKNRLIGYEKIYYDGWHHMICFWFFCMSWSV